MQNCFDLLLYGISGCADLAALEGALRGGITLLQLRAKGLEDPALLARARQVKTLCDAHGVPLIINDRADIAREMDAAGAHLGLGDGELRAARALLGPDKLLGATARTVEQALAAQAAGADYLGSGAVFGSATKADAVTMPLSLFREICGAVHIPVVAIGGISAGNITQLRGCGMAGFAVVSSIFGAAQPELAARELRTLAKETIKQNPR